MIKYQVKNNEKWLKNNGNEQKLNTVAVLNISIVLITIQQFLNMNRQFLTLWLPLFWLRTEFSWNFATFGQPQHPVTFGQ